VGPPSVLINGFLGIPGPFFPVEKIKALPRPLSVVDVIFFPTPKVSVFQLPKHGGPQTELGRLSERVPMNVRFLLPFSVSEFCRLSL